MRVLVMFDLPTETAEDRRNYRKFRKDLIHSGFVMMQESIYTRIIFSPSQQGSVYNAVKKNKPTNGLVQILTITEKQFSHMEYIVGTSCSEIIDTDEKLVVL